MNAPLFHKPTGIYMDVLINYLSNFYEHSYSYARLVKGLIWERIDMYTKTHVNLP